MTEAATQLTVTLKVNRHSPHGGTRHIEFAFDQPLLARDEQLMVTPLSYSPDKCDNCTPFFREILGRIFGGENIGVTQVLVRQYELIVDHYAALKHDTLVRILREAAMDADMTFLFADET